MKTLYGNEDAGWVEMPDGIDMQDGSKGRKMGMAICEGMKIQDRMIMRNMMGMLDRLKVQDGNGYQRRMGIGLGYKTEIQDGMWMKFKR